LLKRAVFERILDQLISPKLVFKEFIQNVIINVGFFLNETQPLKLMQYALCFML